MKIIINIVQEASKYCVGMKHVLVVNVVFESAKLIYGPLEMEWLQLQRLLFYSIWRGVLKCGFLRYMMHPYLARSRLHRESFICE